MVTSRLWRYRRPQLGDVAVEGAAGAVALEGPGQQGADGEVLAHLHEALDGRGVAGHPGHAQAGRHVLGEAVGLDHDTVVVVAPAAWAEAARRSRSRSSSCPRAPSPAARSPARPAPGVGRRAAPCRWGRGRWGSCRSASAWRRRPAARRAPGAAPRRPCRRRRGARCAMVAPVAAMNRRVWG